MSDAVDFESLPKSEKSWMVTLILMLIPISCIFGIHQFYAGNPIKALIRWIPIVGFVLNILDLVSLFGGKFLDGDGNVIRK